MLLALAVILNAVSIPLGPGLEIAFTFVPVALGCMLFGPVVGGMLGALTDIVGYFIAPTGAYMPFLTISWAATGVIYGLFLFNKEKITWKHILTVQIIISLFINILLNTYWHTFFVGKAFMVLLPARALKELIYFPIRYVLVYIMAKYVPVIKNKFNY